MGFIDKMKRKLQIRSKAGRIFFAEVLGSFLLCTFGNGSVAQSVLSKTTKGDFISINWGYGLGAGFGVFVSGTASGGHLNPAVTLALALQRKIRWCLFPLYIIAQLLGTFISSMVVYIVYYDGLNHFDGGNRTVTGPTATAGIFSTYPLDHVSSMNAFGDQIVGTMLLVLCVLAISDNKNIKPTSGLGPLIVGLLVFLMGTSFGYNCGYAINPARDLGPRIFTAIAGWGIEPFSYRGYNWFWIPIVGPLLGSILATVIYPLLIGLHLPDESDEVDEEKSPDDDIRIVSCCSTTSNDFNLSKF